MGRNVICASAISCDAYHAGLAKTLHSHYGLQTAELNAQLLIQRCLKRQNVVEQIASTNILIWDEMSMSSQRLLNLANAIQQKTSHNNLPFGGIQMIFTLVSLTAFSPTHTGSFY